MAKSNLPLVRVTDDNHDWLTSVSKSDDRTLTYTLAKILDAVRSKAQNMDELKEVLSHIERIEN